MNSPAQDLQTLKVLLIDDDPATLCLTERFLKRLPQWQIDCQSCSDSRQVMAPFDGKYPDVVMVDYLLGLENGLNLIERLQREGWSSAFILLTGHGDERIAADAVRAGVKDYLIKDDLNEQMLDRSLRYVTKRVQAEKELKALNKELEQRVVERTHELQQSHDALHDAVERLRKTQGQLVESEKLAALGGVVAGIAHEMNTPLGVCITAISHLGDLLQDVVQQKNSQSLTQDSFDSFCAEAQDGIAITRLNLRKSAELIQSFKQVTVDQTLEEPQRFNLKQHLEEVISVFRTRLQAQQIRLTLECPDAIFLNSYPGAFYQIISQLILNSIAHGFCYQPDKDISLEVVQQVEQLRLVYRDNGVGMAEDIKDKIFEPFSTSKREKSHLGLGGHVIYNQAVRVLQGEIQCDSRPGEGCCFIIHIPQTHPAIS